MYRVFYYFDDIHDCNCEKYEFVEFPMHGYIDLLNEVNDAIICLSQLNRNLIKRIEIIFVPNGD